MKRKSAEQDEAAVVEVPEADPPRPPRCPAPVQRDGAGGSAPATASSQIPCFERAAGRRYAGLREEDQATEPFAFFVIADPQIGMEACFRGGEITDWDTELLLLHRAVEEVNRLRPAFVIVVGDLVDEFPAAEEGRNCRAATRAKQIADFKEAFRRVDPAIPVMFVCGNHDVGDRPNAETIAEYRDHFGDDFYTFWLNGTKCIVLNTSFWKDDSGAKELREEHDRWLEQELEAVEASEGQCRLLVFAHHPPFLFDQDESDEYFNLDSDLRQSILSKLADRGAVAWFCGHFHRNAGGTYRSPSGRELEVVVSGAAGCMIKERPNSTRKDILGKRAIGGCELGEKVSGLRLVRVFSDHVEHGWKTFDDLTKLGPQDLLASQA